LFPDVEDFNLIVDSAYEYFVIGVIEGNGCDLVLVEVLEHFAPDSGVPQFHGAVVRASDQHFSASASGVAAVDEAGVSLYLLDALVLLEVPDGHRLVRRGREQPTRVLRKLHI